jgi:hypothetical protein
MTLSIQNESFWEISSEFLLHSRSLFGNRPPVTKFVYRPPEEILVLGSGLDIPSHKALMSSYQSKNLTHTGHWVRGILLREKSIIYYRQGVVELGWYDLTTEMLKQHGMPSSYTVRWGSEAKRDLKEDIAPFP